MWEPKYGEDSGLLSVNPISAHRRRPKDADAAFSHFEPPTHLACVESIEDGLRRDIVVGKAWPLAEHGPDLALYIPPHPLHEWILLRPTIYVTASLLGSTTEDTARAKHVFCPAKQPTHSLFVPIRNRGHRSELMVGMGWPLEDEEGFFLRILIYPRHGCFIVRAGYDEG